MAGLNSFFDDKFWGKNSNNAVELSQQTPETDIGSRSGQHNPWWGGHASHEVQFQFWDAFDTNQKWQHLLLKAKKTWKSGEKDYSSVHSQGRLLLGVMLADTKTRPLRLGSDTDFVIQVLAGQISLHLLTRPVDINLCKDQSSTHNTQWWGKRLSRPELPKGGFLGLQRGHSIAQLAMLIAYLPALI